MEGTDEKKGEEAVLEAKRREDYLTHELPAMKSARDRALNRLYLKEGHRFGFKEKTPEDIERFADYLVGEVTEGTYSHPTLVKEVAPILKYEAAIRYNYMPKKGEEDVLGHRAIRQGAKALRKRVEQEAALVKQFQTHQAELGAPTLVRSTVLVDEPTDETYDIPDYPAKPTISRQLRTVIGTQYAGTAVGNAAGVAHDPKAMEYARTLQGLTSADVAPDEREELRQIQRALKPLTLAGFRGDRVGAPEQLVVFQTQLANGQYAVDLGRSQFLYRQGILAKKAKKAGYVSTAALRQQNKPLTLKLVEEATKEAEDAIRQVQARSFGSTIFLKDPRKFAKRIQKGEDPLATFSPYVGFARMLKGIGAVDQEGFDSMMQARAPFARVVYPQSIEGLGRGALHYAQTAEQLGTSNLDYLLNFGPWAPVFSWLLDPSEDMEWGSIQHLMKQSKDYTVFQEAQALGQLVSDFTGADLSPEGAKKLGNASSLALTLLEPDLFAAMLFAPKVIGKGMRGVLKATTGVSTLTDANALRKARQGEKAAVALLKQFEAVPPQTVDEAMGLIRNFSKAYPEEAKVIQAHVAASIAARAGGSFNIGANAAELAAQADKVLDSTKGGVDTVVQGALHGIDELKNVAWTEKARIAASGAGVAFKQLQEAERAEDFRRALAVTGDIRPLKKGKKDKKKGFMENVAKEIKQRLTKLDQQLKKVGDLRAQIASGKLSGADVDKLLMKELATAEKMVRELAPQLANAPVWGAFKNWEAAIEARKAAEAVFKKGLSAKGGTKILAKITKGTKVLAERALTEGRTTEGIVDAFKDQIGTIRDAYKKFGEDLKAERLPAPRKSDSSPAPFLSGKPDDGQFLFDHKGWLKALDKNFGRDVSTKLLSGIRGTDAGRTLWTKLNQTKPSTLTQLERAEVARLGDELAEAAYQKEESPYLLIKQIFRARRNNARLASFSRTSPAKWGALIAQRIASVGSLFDAKLSRLGPWSENVQEVARRASTRGAEDPAQLAEALVYNGASDPEEFGTFIAKTMDTGEAIETARGRYASFNQYGASVFDNFKNWALGVVPVGAKDIGEWLGKEDGFLAVARAALPSRMRVSPEESAMIATMVWKKLPDIDNFNDLHKAVEDATLAALNKGGVRVGRSSLNRENAASLVELNAVGEKVGEATPNYVAKTMMATAMLHGQNLKLVQDDLARALGPAISPEVALKANFVLSQATTDTGASTFTTFFNRSDGFDATGAIEAIERWGVHFDKDAITRFASVLNEANSIQMEFIRVGSDIATGAGVFVPRPFKAQLEQLLTKAVKILDATPMEAMALTTKGALDKWLRAWRTSVTRGLILPRPAYFVNQAAGDFAQILMNEGAVQIRRGKGEYEGQIYFTGALPMTFQNAFTYIPFIGPRVSAAVESAGKVATEKGVPFLSGPLNALLNPFIQEVLQVKKARGFYHTAEGPVRGDRLIAEMAEDNVFDIMYSEDLRTLAGTWERKTFPKRWADTFSSPKEAFQAWQKTWNDMLFQTQNHQRAGVYLEYRLRRGATREEARKAVESTLYDWRHGLTDWEMKGLAALGAFYPYTRLATQQMANALMEPLTWTPTETFVNAIRGSSQLNRTRRLGQVLNNMPRWVDWEEDETQLNYAMAVQRLNTNDYPFWAGGRAILTSGPLSSMQQEALKQRTGRDHTTYFRSGPSFGTPETLEMYLALFNYMVGVASPLLGSEDVMATADASEEAMKTLILDQLNPLSKGFVESQYKAWTERGGFQYRNPLGKRIRVDQATMLRLVRDLPFFGEFILEDERGYYVDGAAQAMLNMTPVIASEIPNYLRVISGLTQEGTDPAWEEGIAKGLAFTLADFAGLARLYTSDPEYSRDWTAREIANEISTDLKRLEKQGAARDIPGRELIKYEE